MSPVSLFLIMEMWKSLLIPEEILRSISDLGFEEPTPIQQQVIPTAIRDYVDILGSAPTVKRGLIFSFVSIALSS